MDKFEKSCVENEKEVLGILLTARNQIFNIESEILEHGVSEDLDFDMPEVFETLLEATVKVASVSSAKLAVSSGVLKVSEVSDESN